MKKFSMDAWREIFQEQIQEVKPTDVWSLKMDRQLAHSKYGRKQVLQENAHASFTCSQCHHSWSSHQVVIQFLMCWEPFEHQGWVRLKVFRQQCDRCFSEKYEEPQFTKTDVDNVIRHLILDIRERCYREWVDRSELSQVVWEQTGPHKHQHCEACKLGIHKWRHGARQGTGHPGKVQRPVHSRHAVETKTAIPSSATTPPLEDGLSLAASCCGCFCLIVIFILISIVYLGWQNSG